MQRACLTWLCLCGLASGVRAEDFDVVVYGATPGGISAAVNAAREGVQVALVQENGHVGGLSSGGLSNSDFKSFESLGGTFREFMQRVEQHYADTHGRDSQQVIDCVKGAYYEPHVAKLVFQRMLDEAGVSVMLHHRLLNIQLENRRSNGRAPATFIKAAPHDAETRLWAKVFIDGTYEGDLMAAAGAEYWLGCESYHRYGETKRLAFEEPNPYVQTYNFRVCLSSVPDNRLPIRKPAGYERSRYAPLIEYVRQGIVEDALEERMGSKAVLQYRPLVNGKADFNDVKESPISLSIENINHPWPEGDANTRREIYEHYRRHSLGLLWFLANDPEVPDHWRTAMRRWGLPKDEYVENEHWSPALYVREGRRIVGNYVFTQHDTAAHAPEEARARLHRDSIAIGDYPHSCHGVYRPPQSHHSLGAGGKSIHGPFQIPFGVIVPKKINDLLAPVPVSASHVGFCALRMEPTWTALGQAAGVAAAMSIREGIELREIDVRRLQLRLHELGALTVYIADVGELTEVPRPPWDHPGTTFAVHLAHVPPRSAYFRAAQFFGTQGFLHGLKNEAERDYPPPATGQWSLAWANHELQPETPLTRKLAERWLRMADALGIDPGLSAAAAIDRKLTRGELLIHLFKQMQNAGK